MTATFTRRTLAALAGVLMCLSTIAAPAPWYKWRSTVDGKEICAQTSPGAGWTRISGPYSNSRCGEPLVSPSQS